MKDATDDFERIQTVHGQPCSPNAAPKACKRTAEEIGIDDLQATLSPDERYWTAPLKKPWSHTKGGFYHDGRVPTLLDVVDHYDGQFGLGLNDAEKSELVEYVKSL